MPVAFYMDEHVEDAIMRGLRRRGVDVLRVQDDGHAKTDGEIILDRAVTIGRVVFTRDDDFLVIARRRQTTGVHFAGVIYAHQLGPSIGRCVTALEVYATNSNPPDWEDRVQYVPK